MFARMSLEGDMRGPTLPPAGHTAVQCPPIEKNRQRSCVQFLWATALLKIHRQKENDEATYLPDRRGMSCWPTQ